MTARRQTVIWLRVSVALMIIAIYIVVWISGGTSTAFPHLFYIPIILAALLLSWKESLLTAVIIGLLLSQWLMPLSRDPWVPQSTSNWVVRLILFVIVSVWTSLVFKIQQKRAQKYESNASELMQLNHASLHALVEMAELRDSEVTGKHIQRLQYYARLLTDQLGVDQTQKNLIMWALAFHDIGKVAIPDGILNKPGPLTEQEWEIMKQHPVQGAKIFDSITSSVTITDPLIRDYLQIAHDVILYHHERWDGSGYPHGLAGEQIPLSARIAALCDVYDSLRSLRPYKNAFTHQEAVEVIMAGSGTHFDPAIVKAFSQIADRFDEVWENQETLKTQTAM